VLILRSCN